MPAPAPALLIPSEVAKLEGETLTEDQLKEMQKSGNVPMNIDISMNPAIHKVKSGNEDIMVLMIDAPPCGCRKVDGKKERCRIHRKEKRNKKAKKSKEKKQAKAEPADSGLVKDDESDRKKLAALRHAEDSEEEHDAVDGAITPDKICIAGPAGVGVLVVIDSEGNKKAAPRANKEVGKEVRGIVVLGAQDCPQFIPENKIPLDNGKPAYAKYTAGTLVKKENGEAVFYPDGGNKFDQKGNPIAIDGAGVDKKFQQKVGKDYHYAGVVDVNKAGMPEFRMVDEKNCAPQDKNALVGCLAVNDGAVQFVQTKGQAVGSGDQGALIPTTKEGAVPAGTVLGELILDKKTGRVVCVPKGQANGQTVVATVVQGNYNQPIIVATKEGPLAAGTTCPTKEAAVNKDVQWQKLVVVDEKVQKGSTGEMAKNNVAAQAVMLGCTPEQVSEMNKKAGNDVGRGCLQYGKTAEVPAEAAGTPTGAAAAPAGATAGATAGANEVAGGAAPAAPQEIKSVAFIPGENYGGSVFAMSAPKSAAGAKVGAKAAVQPKGTMSGQAAGATGAASTGPQAVSAGPQAVSAGLQAVSAGPQATSTGPQAASAGPQAASAGPQEIKSVAFYPGGGGGAGGSVFAMSAAKPVGTSGASGASGAKPTSNGLAPAAVGTNAQSSVKPAGAPSGSTAGSPGTTSGKAAANAAPGATGAAASAPQEVRSVAFYPGGGGGAGGSVFAVSQSRPAAASGASAGAGKSGGLVPVTPGKSVMGGVKGGNAGSGGMAAGAASTSPKEPASVACFGPGAGYQQTVQYTVINKNAASGGGASGGMGGASGGMGGASGGMGGASGGMGGASGGMGGAAGGMGGASGPQEVKSVACFGAGAAYAYGGSVHATTSNKAAAANMPAKQDNKSAFVGNNNGPLQAYEARSQFYSK